jgi:uncharacterized membrane-anchored protein
MASTPPSMSNSNRRAGIQEALRAPVLRKVPEVTLAFWVTKVLTTGMGETTSDFLVHDIGPIAAVLIGAVALAGALWIQLAARCYVVWIYWLAVVMVAVFGTMAADALHVEIGIPYGASATFFALALAAVFAVWYRVEGTLSIHHIDTRRRELFYWATVLTTFALGTAVGDMTARTMHLGFATSGIVFTVAIAIPLVAWRFLELNAVVAFWSAYILTRPVGASFSDWVAVVHRHGGLGAGYGPVSLVLTALIGACVAYLAGRSRIVPATAG